MSIDPTADTKANEIWQQGAVSTEQVVDGLVEEFRGLIRDKVSTKRLVLWLRPALNRLAQSSRLTNENRVSNEARAEAAEAQKTKAVGRRNVVTGEVEPLQYPEIASPKMLDMWVVDGAGGGKYFGDMTAADLTARRERLELNVSRLMPNIERTREAEDIMWRFDPTGQKSTVREALAAGVVVEMPHLADAAV